MNSNVTYVRWKAGEPRRGRVFPALTPGHPAHAAPCALCGGDLGDASVQLLVVSDAAEPAAEHWHAAEAALTHETCLAPLTDSEMEAAIGELVRHTSRYD